MQAGRKIFKAVPGLLEATAETTTAINLVFVTTKDFFNFAGKPRGGFPFHFSVHFPNHIHILTRRFLVRHPFFYFLRKPKWGDFRSVILYNFRTLSSPLHAGSWNVINFYIVRGCQMGGFEIGHSVHFPNHIHILTRPFLVRHPFFIFR
jgi:hypothetical protein